MKTDSNEPLPLLSKLSIGWYQRSRMSQVLLLHERFVEWALENRNMERVAMESVVDGSESVALRN